MDQLLEQTNSYGGFSLWLGECAVPQLELWKAGLEWESLVRESMLAPNGVDPFKVITPPPNL